MALLMQGGIGPLKTNTIFITSEESVMALLMQGGLGPLKTNTIFIISEESVMAVESSRPPRKVVCQKARKMLAQDSAAQTKPG